MFLISLVALAAVTFTGTLAFFLMNIVDSYSVCEPFHLQINAITAICAINYFDLRTETWVFPIAAHPISFTYFSSSQFFSTHFLHSSVTGHNSCHSPVLGVMNIHPFYVSTQIHYYRSLIYTYQRESGVYKEHQTSAAMPYPCSPHRLS